MPSIASVNYVVMQADQTREAQNIRNFAQDVTQPIVVAKQEKNDEIKKTTVQTSDQSDQIKLKRDKEKEEQQQRKKQSKKDLETEEEVVEQVETGTPNAHYVKTVKRKRILDIFA